MSELREAAQEALFWMHHARLHLTIKERLHPDGLIQYDNAARNLRAALAQPETEAGVSWGGHNVRGDADSIAEVRRLIDFEQARQGAKPETDAPSDEWRPASEPQEGSKPHAYLMEKLAMVMPLFQEARDALTAITEQQRIARGISPTLADRMDAAGTYSVDDWYRNHALNKLPSHKCSSLCSPDETFCAITKDGKCDAMDRSCDAIS